LEGTKIWKSRDPEDWYWQLQTAIRVSNWPSSSSSWAWSNDKSL